jgi:hypothetical protein
MTDDNKRPIKEFRAGCIRASIWSKKREKDGRTIDQNTVRIEKRFFDEKTKEWKASDCFFVDELPRLRLVAERAFDFIVLRESSNALCEKSRA